MLPCPTPGGNSWSTEAAFHICELARKAAARGDQQAAAILANTAALLQAVGADRPHGSGRSLD